MAKDTQKPLPTAEPARSIALSASQPAGNGKAPPKTPEQRWASLGAKRFMAVAAALARLARLGNRRQYRAPAGKLEQYTATLKDQWDRTLAALEAKETAKPFSLFD